MNPKNNNMYSTERFNNNNNIVPAQPVPIIQGNNVYPKSYPQPIVQPGVQPISIIVNQDVSSFHH